MEAPTLILVGSGLVAYALVPRMIRWHQLHKRVRQPLPENGHDRATRRELQWYWRPAREVRGEHLSSNSTKRAANVLVLPTLPGAE